MRDTELTSLKRAVSLAGGQAPLARRLRAACGGNVKQGHVWYWLNKARKAPAEYAIAIEEVTDGAVSRYELRPDVFGLPSVSDGGEQR